MKQISIAIAVMWLATLIPLGLSGQQPEPPAQKQESELPPLKAQCQTEDQDFVKGQNLEIRCVFLIKKNVTLNLDSLRQIATDNFEIIELSSTDPAPVPNQKDYNIVFTTIVLRPNPELKYGEYPFNLELSYSYPESKWENVEGKQVLKTEVKIAVEKIPEMVFEKKPLIARVETGEGFQDVVNIGEHVSYTLRVFYEKGGATLLNDLTPLELEQKYGIRNATRLDDPDFGPFVMIDKDKMSKKEIDRGFHKELAYDYRLALYDVSLVKMFEIPQINLYYLVKGENKPVQLTTPTVKIRTNSVLNQDSDFRPLKSILKPDPEKLRQFGFWPLRAAYIFASLAGLIILYAILAFIAKRIKKAYRTGLRAALAEMKKSVIAMFNKLPFVMLAKARRALGRLKAEPNQKNLKVFINSFRLYLGTLRKIPRNLALSYTAAELCAEETKNYEIIENAEWLLDEDEITETDIKVLGNAFRLIPSASPRLNLIKKIFVALGGYLKLYLKVLIKKLDELTRKLIRKLTEKVRR